MTSTIFLEWFNEKFSNEVESYCRENNIPFNILLIIDNAPSHPYSIVNSHPNIKVVFLPPNTTALIQPMDQGVISTFKSYYLRRTYTKAVNEIDKGKISLVDFWKKYSIKDCILNIRDS